MSRALAVALLATVYLLALASLDPLDVAAAVVVSILVLALLHRFLLELPPVPGRELARRVLRFPLFALAVLREITVGTWRVALIVVGVRPLSRPGIVAVPIGERTPTGVAATTLAITLSPGELLVDVDWQREVMLIHVLDARDPEAVRGYYEGFYRRYQSQVFP